MQTFPDQLAVQQEKKRKTILSKSFCSFSSFVKSPASPSSTSVLSDVSDPLLRYVSSLQVSIHHEIEGSQSSFFFFFLSFSFSFSFLFFFFLIPHAKFGVIFIFFCKLLIITFSCNN